ncbi:MAG: precorrin-6y C5,15-methyltransferase (decarboxylating) subunit CbiE [Bacillota bacterium]
MHKVKVIGVGPGSPGCLTEEARAAIAGARIVIGGKRHIESFCGKDQLKFILANNLEEVLEVIRSRRDEGIAVLATGDPGMYGILSFLRDRLGPENIAVLPGISSVQMAFARLCLPWHDAVVLSAHGRSPEKVAEIAEKAGKLAVLTGNDNPPETLFALMENMGGRKKYYFCFDLSLQGEEIILLNSGDKYPNEYKGRHNCVMVVLNE